MSGGGGGGGHSIMLMPVPLPLLSVLTLMSTGKTYSYPYEDKRCSSDRHHRRDCCSSRLPGL